MRGRVDSIGGVDATRADTRRSVGCDASSGDDTGIVRRDQPTLRLQQPCLDLGSTTWPSLPAMLSCAITAQVIAHCSARENESELVDVVLLEIAPETLQPIEHIAGLEIASRASDVNEPASVERAFFEEHERNAPLVFHDHFVAVTTTSSCARRAFCPVDGWQAP